eukprot:Tamp_03392.p3 GENE.Tamp_03392~~Tamp_03392.p3  ORF type:complete len:321 (+),score=94.39 Tamp_03392:2686-3648(+)
MDACCMCPLYDTETGEITGWTNDVPNDPAAAAAMYRDAAEYITQREQKLDDAEGASLLDPSWLGDKYHVTVASASEDGAEPVAAGNSTGNATDGAAEEGEEEAAEEAPNVAHLAQKRVTHLAQVVPTATVVGRAQAHGSPRAAQPAGMQSPLQAKAKAAAMPSAATGKAQTPLQAFAQPLASVATAVARGQLPKAVEAIAQPAPKRVAVAKAKAVEPVQRPQAKRPAVPVAAARLPRQQMQATHVGGMKAAPVAARAGPVHGAHAKAPAQAVATPVTPNVAAEAPVQAVAEPMTKAVAAEKPVMAVAQPVVPIKQVAGAV